MKTAVAPMLCGMMLLTVCSVVGAANRTIEKISSISAEPIVTMPPNASFFGVASNLKKEGAVGAAIAQKDNEPGAILSKLLSDRQIDVAAIIRAQFAAKIKNTKLAEKIRESADAQLILEVKDYGLGKGWGMSNNMKPSITASAAIVTAAGVKLWKKKALVGGIDKELPIRPDKEWFANPELLSEAYLKAATLLSEKMLKEFE